MVGEALVEIIDLEKDRLAVSFERAKIVLFVRVVGVAKVVEHGDCFGDARDSLGAECSDAASHHSTAMAEVLPQVIVECANAFGLIELGLGRHGRLRCDW
jgi:hypothetical protein